jgi:hypothetical protein
MAHRNGHGLTLQVNCAAQLPGFRRGLERARVVTTLCMHSAVAWMKPLKVLVDHLNQFIGSAVLTVIHVFSFS